MTARKRIASRKEVSRKSSENEKPRMETDRKVSEIALTRLECDQEETGVAQEALRELDERFWKEQEETLTDCERLKARKCEL